ncbi:retropepsin-like aspartic protease, partial [Acinetobacter baumannii]
PFTTEGNELKVEAAINGKTFPAYFDTGAGVTAISLKDLTSINLPVPPDRQLAQISGVGGSSVGYVFNVDRFSLGPIQKTNFRITV